MRTDKIAHLPSGVGGHELFDGSTVRKPPGISRAENIPLQSNVNVVNAGVKGLLQRRNGCFCMLKLPGKCLVYEHRINIKFKHLTIQILNANPINGCRNDIR